MDAVLSRIALSMIPHYSKVVVHTLEKIVHVLGHPVSP